MRRLCTSGACLARPSVPLCTGYSRCHSAGSIFSGGGMRSGPSTAHCKSEKAINRKCPAGMLDLQDSPTRLESLLLGGVRLTSACHELWSQFVRPGDTVVDATCGDGADTLWLAQAVGMHGKLFAIDIQLENNLQEEAIAATAAKLESCIPDGEMPVVHLVQSCHSRLQELVGSNCARLVCFNLGYRPSGDKQLITKVDSTVQAVEAALEAVMPGGLVSVLCYIKHPGGYEEYKGVRLLLVELPSEHWVCNQTQILNRPTAPVLLFAWRRAGS